MVKNFSRGRVDPSLDFNTDFCLKSAVGAQDFPYCTQFFSAKRERERERDKASLAVDKQKVCKVQGRRERERERKPRLQWTRRRFAR